MKAQQEEYLQRSVKPDDYSAQSEQNHCFPQQLREHPSYWGDRDQIHQKRKSMFLIIPTYRINGTARKYSLGIKTR